MSEWAAKRFWKTAEVIAKADGFTVQLDGRPVRTPAKAPLVVPSQQMAAAIAAEWDAQDEKINPLSMPVTRAANATVDKVVPQFDDVAALLASYGETDLLCYRAVAPETLALRQSEAWDPLLEWAADRFGARLHAMPGVMYQPQPQESIDRLAAEVRRHDPFELTALNEVVTLSGSLIIGLAVTERHLEAEDLWNRSLVDEIYQREVWGADEEADATRALKQNDFLQARRFLDLHRPSAI
ncbi:Chaperone required for the assembly of the F1-ATPase [Poseidonocella pacifica]|uniref:Chaperone required for the assembly of the F1-ATPase n=1 Tax=Poseidonocella pacifica TaxID=871651 RepID=A0A1I0XH63_9RHOB|nr:ATP12 family protein [Poseidonocella pacifica]SFB00439.1 Chaperone required for the assembly of the F1-ATPase [Poseidonocella pacifica]